MSGYIGPIPVPQGIQNKQTFTATAGQTTFNTNGYTDGAFINVFLNGVRLVNGTDYTATNGSDVVLASGANAGDVLDFETINDVQLVSNTSTTPIFKTSATLKNDTEEDTDGGRESTLIFQGEQSGGEISTLAEIEASHDGTSDDEKGDLIFRTNDGSDGASPTERMRIDSAGQTKITGTGNILTVNAASGVAYQNFQENNTNRFFLATLNGADGLAFVDADGSAERMRIASDGKVGIGKTDPKESLNSGAIVVEGDHATGVNAMGGSVGLLLSATGDTAFITSTSSGNSNRNMQIRALNSGSANANQIFLSYTGATLFNTNNTNVGIDGVRILPNGSGSGTLSEFMNDGGGVALRVGRGGSDGHCTQFARGSIVVGSIGVTSSATSYNTSSDYRLKENVETLSDGITRVKQLKPKRFSWIIDEADSANVDGFLAHEAQAVVPEAVDGTHNEVDDNGNAVMQGIDQSKLVPLLTAALQEAITKIETLETEMTSVKSRLDALEAE